MKRRSREINVFSISALDLFASALGAFILMSLIFMVFFAMTSQDSGQDEGVAAALAECRELLAGSVDSTELESCRAQLDQAREQQAALAEQLDQAREQQAALAEQLDQAQVPHLDVVICLDITGSMEGHIAGLKQEVSDLARVLDALAPSAALGVVAYGDIQYDRVTHTHPIVNTSSMASLRRFVETLQPGLGMGSGSSGDVPEAVYTALSEAVAMNWRVESERRYIIVITDAGAYPDREASSYDLARRFAMSGDQYVSTVMVGRNLAEQFLRDLARSGQGEFVNDIGGQSMIASVLLAILDV